jgi:hypothetical protein
MLLTREKGRLDRGKRDGLRLFEVGRDIGKIVVLAFLVLTMLARMIPSTLHSNQSIACSANAAQASS